MLVVALRISAGHTSLARRSSGLPRDVSSGTDSTSSTGASDGAGRVACAGREAARRVALWWVAGAAAAQANAAASASTPIATIGMRGCGLRGMNARMRRKMVRAVAPGLQTPGRGPGRDCMDLRGPRAALYARAMSLTQIDLTRRQVRVTCRVGGVPLGGGHPIVVQSMTNTDTEDPVATAAQALMLAEAGSELVRVTVNTREAAAAVPEIRRRLADQGCGVPLVGDFHYNGHLLLTEYPDCA